MKKYSRQRELILQSLKKRVDHPTAETLYADLKVQMPEIGIATVYRNLADLCETGDIIKIKSKSGPDRFDGNPEPHIHFECDECHEIYDIFIQDNQTKKIDNEIKRLAENIDAQSHTSNIWIYGLCKKCKVLANFKK
ncbi:MAG: Fur family transcriptional regulator [Clostridia bacterium]